MPQPGNSHNAVFVTTPFVTHLLGITLLQSLEFLSFCRHEGINLGNYPHLGQKQKERLCALPLFFKVMEYPAGESVSMNQLSLNAPLYR